MHQALHFIGIQSFVHQDEGIHDFLNHWVNILISRRNGQAIYTIFSGKPDHIDSKLISFLVVYLNFRNFKVRPCPAQIVPGLTFYFTGFLSPVAQLPFNMTVEYILIRT